MSDRQARKRRGIVRATLDSDVVPTCALQAPHGREPVTHPSDHRAKVLVVDDVADLADSLVALLRLEGFDAQAAYDGGHALALAESFDPHCILFDIGMPGVDGLELAERLRRLHGDSIVLLAMTGRSRTDPRVASALGLVDHYFAKPVELETLLKVLAP